jgi:hypothetical protein
MGANGTLTSNSPRYRGMSRVAEDVRSDPSSRSFVGPVGVIHLMDVLGAALESRTDSRHKDQDEAGTETIVTPVRAWVSRRKADSQRRHNRYRPADREVARWSPHSRDGWNNPVTEHNLRRWTPTTSPQTKDAYRKKTHNLIDVPSASAFGIHRNRKKLSAKT